MTNDFRVLYRLRGVELYIVAMNLDTAERVVFGHDEDTLAHDLRGGAGVDRAPRLLQARAPQAASTTSTAACAAPRTSTSRSSTAPISSSATTRSGRSRTASCGAYIPERNRVHARGPAARRPGHADGAEPGVPHAAPLAPPARHPAVSGRSALRGRHHPARAGRDRPHLLQDGAAEPLGGPQRRGARLPLGHRSRSRRTTSSSGRSCRATAS